MATAEQCKQRGNEHFKLGQFELAAGAYSEAIRQDPGIAAYWLNRSIAYRQLLMWDDALQDAEQALLLEPLNEKARYSQVLCLQGLRHYVAALKMCEQGLEAQPEGKALLQLRTQLQEQVRKRPAAPVEPAQQPGFAELSPSRQNTSRARSDSSSSSVSSDELGAWGLKRKAPRALKDDELKHKLLGECAERGDVDACRRLIEEDGADPTWCNPHKSNNTALHVAAEEGHEKVARYLLAARANPMTLNEYQLTSFSLAARDTPVWRLLLGVTKHLNERRLCELRRG